VGTGRNHYGFDFMGAFSPKVMVITCDCILCYKTDGVLRTLLLLLLLLLLQIKIKQNIGEGTCGLITIRSFPWLKIIQNKVLCILLRVFMSYFLNL